MKFNKSHKVDIKTLSKTEAEVFVEFLILEFNRHNTAIEQANAFVLFWESAKERHKEDRERADALIERVEKEILDE